MEDDFTALVGRREYGLSDGEWLPSPKLAMTGAELSRCLPSSVSRNFVRL